MYYVCMVEKKKKKVETKKKNERKLSCSSTLSLTNECSRLDRP